MAIEVLLDLSSNLINDIFQIITGLKPVEYCKVMHLFSVVF